MIRKKDYGTEKTTALKLGTSPPIKYQPQYSNSGAAAAGILEPRGLRLRVSSPVFGSFFMLHGILESFKCLEFIKHTKTYPKRTNQKLDTMFLLSIDLGGMILALEKLEDVSDAAKKSWPKPV